MRASHSSSKCVTLVLTVYLVPVPLFSAIQQKWWTKSICKQAMRITKTSIQDYSTIWHPRDYRQQSNPAGYVPITDFDSFHIQMLWGTLSMGIPVNGGFYLTSLMAWSSSSSRDGGAHLYHVYSFEKRSWTYLRCQYCWFERAKKLDKPDGEPMPKITNALPSTMTDELTLDEISEKWR